MCRLSLGQRETGKGGGREGESGGNPNPRTDGGGREAGDEGWLSVTGLIK